MASFLLFICGVICTAIGINLFKNKLRTLSLSIGGLDDKKITEKQNILSICCKFITIGIMFLIFSLTLFQI